MGDIVRVQDIMTREVVTVGPHESLAAIAQLFEEHKFAGLPVVDDGKRLLGIVTSYDMVLQSRVHMPNILGIIGDISRNEIDERMLETHFRRLRQIKVKDIMYPDPLVVAADVRVEDLVGEFAEHHRVNPIPVIDKDKVLLGVVTRYDIIRFFSKHYIMRILEDAGHHGILQRLTRLQEES
jgi:CBS-domain-containing membrane protein